MSKRHQIHKIKMNDKCSIKNYERSGHITLKSLYILVIFIEEKKTLRIEIKLICVKHNRS